MNGKMTLLSEGRFDEIDILSSGEMNNILGGVDIICDSGYCQKSYSETKNGAIACGCGYVKPIKDPSEKPDDNSGPVRP